MEFILSELINFFITPEYIIMFIPLILIYCFYFKKKKIFKFFSYLYVLLFLFFSYLPLSNYLLNKIELYIQKPNITKNNLKGIIILGGSFDIGSLPLEVNLNSSAERLTKALEIYKIYKGNILILFTGNSVKQNYLGEVELAKKFFESQGVRRDKLIFESNSTNTYLNIKNSSKIIIENPGKWGIVTSAFHMPRVILLLKKINLYLEPIPVDYKSKPYDNISFLDFNIEVSFKNWFLIFHEFFGILYYKLTNKI